MLKYLCFGQNIAQKYFHQNIPEVPKVGVLHYYILQLLKVALIFITSCITYYVNLQIQPSQFK